MIGSLKHRFTIMQAVETLDQAGGKTTVWQELSQDSKFWGSLKEVSGELRYQFMQQTLNVTHKIQLRLRTGLSQENRLVKGGRYFKILSLTKDEQHHKKMLLLVREMDTL